MTMSLPGIHGEEREKRETFFVVAPRRSHMDMFTNIQNDATSGLLKCNNNIVACVDGGSPLYCTAYHSKNTQKEDSETTGIAAQKMIQKMSLEISRHEESQKQSEASAMPTQDLDAVVLGLKTMVRAVLVATNAHIVRAPMAFFVARHQSIFWYSHEFTYCNLMNF
jgi:hypothetical protein